MPELFTSLLDFPRNFYAAFGAYKFGELLSSFLCLFRFFSDIKRVQYRTHNAHAVVWVGSRFRFLHFGSLPRVAGTIFINILLADIICNELPEENLI